MCLNTKLVPNPRYKANKKNGGVVKKPKDWRLLLVPIKCGECTECRKADRRQWRIRLKEELRANPIATFITLTFSNEAITKIYNLPEHAHLKGYALDNRAATYAHEQFQNNWKKKHKHRLKHWLITELGHEGTENIHLHGILWTKDKEAINKAWKHGWIYHGIYVGEDTINYITKYITKADIKHKTYKPIKLISNGIGKEYTHTTKARENYYKGIYTDERYQDRTGTRMPIPIYYRNKLYTDDERENLWIHKMNQETRYVNGTAIKINTPAGIARYKTLTRQARKQDKILGYTTEQFKRDLTRYEEEQRIIMQQQRNPTRDQIIYQLDEEREAPF